MARTEIQNELYPDCPIRNILARISDKWSILILFTLNQSELMRFNALQKNMGMQNATSMMCLAGVLTVVGALIYPSNKKIKAQAEAKA